MSELKMWRLKHLPTGMYFKPSKHMNKCNLSEKGKVYTSKPTIKWCGGAYHHPDDTPEKRWKHHPNRPVVESEWKAERVGQEGLGILKVRKGKGAVHKIRSICSPCGEYRFACGGAMSWSMKTTDEPITCKRCLAQKDIGEETT